MKTGVQPRTRQIVLERDQHTCQRCGRYVGPFGDFSVHHRAPRGMGGSKDPAINLPANLIVLCGSGTTGCHGHVESNRREAEEQGFIVRRGLVPAYQPLLTYAGWVRLDNDSGKREAFGPGDLRPEEPA